MYYLATPPPLVGGSLPIPGVLPVPVPYGAHEEFAYRTTAGMGTVCSRTGFGTLSLVGQTGILQLSYFRASRSQVLTRWDMATVTQAFAATPTLIRGGLYTVDSANNLTLLAASANDTTIGAVGNSKFGKVFAAQPEVHFGQRYAFGFLFVSAATAAGVLGVLSPAGSSNFTMLSDPRVNGSLSGQTDLPASIAAGSVTASNTLLWGELS